MRSTRRRLRVHDPLATPFAVRSLCDQLSQRMVDVNLSSVKQLLKFLYAVRHVERRPATDTLRGRPSRWPREKLTEAASILRGLLERETQGRISVNSFIGQYLPILQFPSDVSQALESSQINLNEAAQIARLIPERLGCSTGEARARREEILKAHLAVQGSQTQLRMRVKEMLGEIMEPSAMLTEVVAVERVDELLEMNPLDSTHLFYEELRRISRAIREVQPEELTDKVLDDLMPVLDQLSAILHSIEIRRSKTEQPQRKLKI